MVVKMKRGDQGFSIQILQVSYLNDVGFFKYMCLLEERVGVGGCNIVRRERVGFRFLGLSVEIPLCLQS
jgi:hypothetical protein